MDIVSWFKAKRHTEPLQGEYLDVGTDAPTPIEHFPAIQRLTPEQIEMFNLRQERARDLIGSLPEKMSVHEKLALLRDATQSLEAQIRAQESYIPLAALAAAQDPGYIPQNPTTREVALAAVRDPGYIPQNPTTREVALAAVRDPGYIPQNPTTREVALAAVRDPGYIPDSREIHSDEPSRDTFERQRG